MSSDDDRSQRIHAAFLRRSEAVTFTPNERRILNLIRSEGPASRADLARKTGLALQSIIRLVEALAERGFLRAGEKVVRGVGQPSAPMMLVNDAAFTIGASVTKGTVSLVLMDLSGRCIAEARHGIDGSELATVAAELGAMIPAILAEAKIDRTRLFGVGVAMTGYFVAPGRLNTPEAMGGWALRDLEVELSDALDLPVWVENDGNAATVGENLFGVGRQHRNFAYLYVAAGLGGGIILDGAPFRGLQGNAGEFTGILPITARPGRPHLGSLVDLLRQDGIEFADIDAMLAAFDPAWPAIDKWLDATQESLAAIVSAIGAVLDPEAIVIGGRLPRSLAERLAERARFYAAPVRGTERPFARVVAAEARGDAAALGAASIPLQQHFFG